MAINRYKINFKKYLRKGFMERGTHEQEHAIGGQ